MPGTTDIELPKGFTARGATVEDAEAVAEVMAASDRRYTGRVFVGPHDVAADYLGASELARDSVLIHRGDRLVAEALIERGRYAYGTVHPEMEGRGIGTAILAWSQDVVRGLGGETIGGTAADANESARELFLANGYSPSWAAWDFEMRHGAAEPPRPELPPGVALRPFEQGEEEVVHRLIEDAFAEWGEGQASFDEWRARALDRPGFAPWMLPVVVDAGEITGAALLVRNPNEVGWVQQLAVRRDRRRRGLGRALLQHSFGEFHRHGMATTGLSTDSRTGARSLYERAGMRLTASYTHFARAL